MTCVAKKIVTLPFGAELPPDLIVSLDELVSRRGWTKKRALAAAVRRLLLADRVDQDDWNEMAYDPIEPGGLAEVEESGPAQSDESPGIVGSAGARRHLLKRESERQSRQAPERRRKPEAG